MRRRGSALLATMVALVALGAASTTLVWQSTAQRRFLAQRERQLQAEWLARSGVEYVRATNGAATEKPWTPAPGAEVRFRTQKSDNGRQFECEGLFRTDEPNPATRVRTVTLP